MSTAPSSTPASSPHTFSSGKIQVRNLRLNTSLVADAWGRKGKEQPTLVSVTLWHGDKLASAARTDDCGQTTSYSEVAKIARQVHEWRDEFVQSAQQLLCNNAATWHADAIEVETVFPKGLLRGLGGWGLRTRRSNTTAPDGRPSFDTDLWFLVRDLRLGCVIGINEHEREAKQDVMVALELKRRHVFGHTGLQEEFMIMVGQLFERVENSTFLTVEALAYDIAQFFGNTNVWSQTTVQIEKPNAIALVDGCGVELTLDWTA